MNCSLTEKLLIYNLLPINLFETMEEVLKIGLLLAFLAAVVLILIFMLFEKKITGR